MRAAFILLILVLAGAGYYEYYRHGQEADAYVQQRTDLISRVAQLKKQNKALADEEAVLSEKLDYLKKQASQLNGQIASVQAETNAPPAAPAPVPGSH